MKLWALENLTLVRGLLLLSCCGYLLILMAWTRPTPSAIRRGLLAGAAQFWIGWVLDVCLVQLGAWRYRDMPFSVAGVPVDLHLDWSLLWGMGLVWLSDRILGRAPATWQVIAYLAAWVSLTLAFDVAIAEWMLFLDSAAWWWWLADLLFLGTALGLSLWLYRSMGTGSSRQCGMGRLPPLPPFLRACVYMSFAPLFFFLYLPAQIDDLAMYFGVHVGGEPMVGLALALALPGLALGGWSVREFAVRGLGTPIPWDAPTQLVTTGPYAWTANPMQQSGLLLALSGLALRPSAAVAVYVFDICLLTTVVIGRVEPTALVRGFGRAYGSYRMRVRNYLWQTSPGEPSRALFFYDAACPWCRATVRVLEGLDGAASLRFVPFTQDCDAAPQTVRESLPVVARLALERGDTAVLYEPPGPGVAQGTVSVRGRALLRATGYLPLPYALVATLDAVPGLSALASPLYRTVAAMRPCPRAGTACHPGGRD